MQAERDPKTLTNTKLVQEEEECGVRRAMEKQRKKDARRFYFLMQNVKSANKSLKSALVKSMDVSYFTEHQRNQIKASIKSINQLEDDLDAFKQSHNQKEW